MPNVNLRCSVWYLLRSDIYPRKSGRKRSQKTGLSRDLPQKVVGDSGVLAARLPGEGAAAGSWEALLSSSQPFAQQPKAGPLFGRLPTPHLVQKVFRKLRVATNLGSLKSAIGAGREHPEAPGPGAPG